MPEITPELRQAMLATLERELTKVETEAAAEAKRVAEMRKRLAEVNAPSAFWVPVSVTIIFRE